MSTPATRPQSSFSLRTLFVGCALAACMATLIGLGYRGEEWARGVSFALVAFAIVFASTTVLFWAFFGLGKISESALSKRTAGGRKPGEPSPLPTVAATQPGGPLSALPSQPDSSPPTRPD